MSQDVQDYDSAKAALERGEDELVSYGFNIEKKVSIFGNARLLPRRGHIFRAQSRAMRSS
jgi:hypothetical protein